VRPVTKTKDTYCPIDIKSVCNIATNVPLKEKPLIGMLMPGRHPARDFLFRDPHKWRNEVNHERDSLPAAISK
jgi:hypothetical protein